ncbi:hypothetical protein GPJ56_001448 [Histomonas meleagridis]|uniref:uncharacterized protein n=1 Tax=Histomonas meleagridis TaxID=135588 RepID=UPI00355A739A|nr:hypothetical protein GPJ56_001448 [Histomonas meleagridis]KAH0798208.1 hypothetical protein GO595_009054 [Histomonas meleagridis]
MASKKGLLADLTGIVENAHTQVKFYRQEIESKRNFVEHLTKIVEQEAPEFNQIMTEISSKLTSSLDNEEALINAYERFAEDFNDVSARFEVVYRLSQETSACKRHLKECRAKIEKARLDLELDEQKGSPKKIKLQAELEKAIQQKREALQDVQAKMEEFINVKVRYNKFKVRRLSHAYTYLAKVLRSSLGGASSDLESVLSLCNQSRENIDYIVEGKEPPKPVEPEETYKVPEEEGVPQFDDASVDVIEEEFAQPTFVQNDAPFAVPNFD